MQVPIQPFDSRKFLRWGTRLTALLLLLLAAPLYAKSGPAISIPLDQLGYEPPAEHVLSTGSTVLTVHYVDNSHLLVTFAVRRLMKRIPDDPPDDEDRIIQAVLLELPSGKPIARTEWRLHDLGQYLWSLNNGTFLLRIRDTLTYFSPLTGLSSGDPFLQHTFLHSQRTIRALLLSPEGDFLTLETADPKPPAKPTTTPGSPMASFYAATSPHPPPPPAPPPAASINPIQINFYRLVSSPDQPGLLHASFAGVARARDTTYLPMNSTGFVDVIDQGTTQWAFDFDTYLGKNIQLALFDSSCAPEPFLVSRSEFIVLACHGGTDRQTLAAFNLRSDQMWEQRLFSSYRAPQFLFAPASGRFAFERVTVPSGSPSIDDLSEQIGSSQIVTVFQTDSGRELLRIDCNPIERFGGNVTLSPDGMNLALVRFGSIEIYRLPPLTPKEAAAVQLAQSLAPEPNQAPVSLRPSREPASRTISTAPRVAANQSAPDPQSAPSTGADQAAPVPTSEHQPVSGDSEAPTRPPTLYTLPTDKQNSSESGRQSPSGSGSDDSDSSPSSTHPSSPHN